MPTSSVRHLRGIPCWLGSKDSLFEASAPLLRRPPRGFWEGGNVDPSSADQARTAVQQGVGWWGRDVDGGGGDLSVGTSLTHSPLLLQKKMLRAWSIARQDHNAVLEERESQLESGRVWVYELCVGQGGQCEQAGDKKASRHKLVASHRFRCRLSFLWGSRVAGDIDEVAVGDMPRLRDALRHGAVVRTHRNRKARRRCRESPG
jgi:hypothetical protein